ncbi:MAG TPA: hypothetical protein VF821_15220, partial [Lentzea sp.]
MHVRVELDKAPSVGETAQVSFEVKSDVDLKSVRIEADVPGIARWGGVPDGFSVSRLTSPVPTDFGAVGRAVRTMDLAAGQVARFRGSVTAASAGTLLVTARAAAPVDPQVNSDTFTAAAAIGADKQSSHLGS